MLSFPVVAQATLLLIASKFGEVFPMYCAH
jgi:hypothetical protein